MLVLFDLDGTLLSARGAGVAAMLVAAERVYGRPFRYHATRIAGNIDPCIWRELCAENGVTDAVEREPEYRAHFRKALEERLGSGAEVTVLAGVRELLSAVEAHPRATLGLLTGNFPETGQLKLRAGELDPGRFQVSVWGSDGACRRELVPVALERFRLRVGRALAPGEAVIVGDTPEDIDCARAHGCPVLGVATGPFSAEELRRAGADEVREDLTDTDGIMAWLEAATFRLRP